jgi:hypothetical protein
MNWRDTIERLAWTFVAGFIAALLGAPAVVNLLENFATVDIDINMWEAVIVSAVFAGLTDVANFVLIVARWRLSVLPNPGEGVPGLPTGVEVPA